MCCIMSGVVSKEKTVKPWSSVRFGAGWGKDFAPHPASYFGGPLVNNQLPVMTMFFIVATMFFILSANCQRNLSCSGISWELKLQQRFVYGVKKTIGTIKFTVATVKNTGGT